MKSLTGSLPHILTLLRVPPDACHRVTPPISPATLTENPTIGVEERSQDPGVVMGRIHIGWHPTPFCLAPLPDCHRL